MSRFAYFLPPRIRLRVLLACALVYASAAIFVGRAVAEEVASDTKGNALVEVRPVERGMTAEKMKRLEQDLHRYFEMQEKLRWKFKTSRTVDDTDRLVPTFGLFDWAA